jgi:hypothetical protein
MLKVRLVNAHNIYYRRHVLLLSDYWLIVSQPFSSLIHNSHNNKALRWDISIQHLKSLVCVHTVTINRAKGQLLYNRTARCTHFRELAVVHIYLKLLK